MHEWECIWVGHLCVLELVSLDGKDVKEMLKH